MDFSDFGGRDLIIAAMIAAAVYLCVSLLRLYRVRHPAHDAGNAEGIMGPYSASANASNGANGSNGSNGSDGSVEFSANEDIAYGFSRRRRAPMPEGPIMPSPMPEIMEIEETLRTTAHSPSAAASQFDERLFRSRVETDLRQLREEITALREALAQINTSRRVAPQYNEAMLLAQRGMDAREIADRCAISLGEADLVVALRRGNKQEYDEHDG